MKWALVGSHHALPVFSRTQRLRLLSAHILLAGRDRRRSRAPRPSVLETDVLLLILPAYFGERRYRTPPRIAGPSVFETAIGLPGFTLHNGRRRARPASALSGPTVFQTAPRPARFTFPIASARLERAISSFAKRCPVQLDDEAVLSGRPELHRHRQFGRLPCCC